MQQDIENNLIITYQMAYLGCLLVCTFDTFQTLILVTAHTVNSFDISHLQRF